MRYPALILTVIALAVGGCALYRPDVAQGNLLTQEQLDLLKPGMSKRQVRFALGTPAIIDTFHPDRWDYYTYVRSDTAPKAPTRLTLFFKEDQLVAASGDRAPATLPAPPAATP